jgi:hypothetical protein
MKKSKDVKTKQKRIIDFPDDPMMQELHDIGRKIDAEIRGMSPQEAARYINGRAQRFAERMGYRYVPAGKGTYRLEKKEKREKIKADS